jgi:hypothetical protein
MRPQTLPDTPEPNKLRYRTCSETRNQVRHASDYFDTFYEAAIYLIKKDLAYVEELSAEEMREYRGTLTEPGRNSPHRDRPIEESLDLFQVGLVFVVLGGVGVWEVYRDRPIEESLDLFRVGLGFGV